MKKLLAVVVLCLTFSGAFSQLVPVTFGPKIGFISSQITTNIKDVKEASKAGFIGGAFVRINLKSLYIQPEAYFTIKGGDYTFSANNVIYEKKLTLNTIDVPLLIGYKLVNLPMVNLRLCAGPVISMTAKSNFTFSTGGVEAESNFDSYRKTGIAATAGIGLDVAKFTLDIRYEMGLRNMNKEDNGTEIKHNNFSVTIGFKIL